MWAILSLSILMAFLGWVQLWSWFTHEEMEIPVFSLWNLFLDKGQEPALPAKGCQASAPVHCSEAHRFLPTPFLYHPSSPSCLSLCTFHSLLLITSQVHTPKTKKNPVRRLVRIWYLVDIKTDTPSQICIQEQTGGAGENVAQWTLLSVPVTRSRLSGTVAIHG